MALAHAARFSADLYYDPEKGAYRGVIVTTDVLTGRTTKRRIDLRPGHAQTDLFNETTQELSHWIDNVCDWSGEAAKQNGQVPQ